MKAIQLLLIGLIIWGYSDKTKTGAEETTNYALEVVDQDFDQAIKLANKNNKLIFIDFYTTWCAPCKQLDKLIFQNDSIKQILGKDYILLRYDAENDTVFHLSKKHHIMSYPTAIVLNPEGYVLAKKYGFAGNDFETLRESVLDFTENSKIAYNQNEYLTGYSNTIDETKYPDFYIDYVNRTDIRPNKLDIINFFESKENFFQEEDFSTLFYFASEASSNVGDKLLEEKEKYFALFGELDLEVLLYFIVSGKFDEAISENNQGKYDQAVVFAKKALGRVDDILPNFEIKRLKAQNKWIEVFEIYEKRKNQDGIGEGEINHICWGIYKNCDNQEVIASCIEWMKELTDKNPRYAFLDTYAFLLFKSGDKKLAKETAERGLRAAEEEGEEARSLKKLLEKL